MPATERTGEAYELGEQLTILGSQLRIGDAAPAFQLESFDGASGTMSSVSLADSAGTVRLLNVINSLDTPVCHIETHRWDRMRTDLPTGSTIYTISMDLPFGQSRWRTAEGIEHLALSAHKNEAFAIDYGVLIKEWRLLQRAVFVIDRQDRIVHAEYVGDQMLEPNYDAAITAVLTAAR